MSKRYDELKIYIDEEKETCRELGIDYPLYLDCYFEALGAILNFIELTGYSNGTAVCRRGNRQEVSFFAVQEDIKNEYLAHSNMIAFMGKRGSGKTTAVNEFCGLLSEYHKKWKEWDRHLSYKNSRQIPYRFHVMPPIDASVLEAKEDLMELIWASMYQIFECEYRKRIGMGEYEKDGSQIAKEFDDVYRNYYNVGRRVKCVCGVGGTGGAAFYDRK